MQQIRSMRGVRKEINYSEPCSNAPDKAQLSFGFNHLSTSERALTRAQMGTTQTQLCFILGILARFGIIYFLIPTPHPGSREVVTTSNFR